MEWGSGHAAMWEPPQGPYSYSFIPKHSQLAAAPFCYIREQRIIQTKYNPKAPPEPTRRPRAAPGGCAGAAGRAARPLCDNAAAPGGTRGVTGTEHGKHTDNTAGTGEAGL